MPRPALLLFAAFLLVLLPGCVPPLQGQASVTDGDSLEIHRQRIRLHGIDAPEGRQTCKRSNGETWRCGQQAARALDAFIDGRPVTCHEVDRDQYDRVVAECSVDGTSLNGWMVRNGWATAYRQFTRAYVADEEAARAEGLGIWEGEFVEPERYRRSGGR